jgi:CHAT domain-containing protein/tetratricopeptide (TPR) repeat protein
MLEGEVDEARRLFDRGQHAQAGAAARRACERREAALGEGPELAEALNLLGDAQVASGDFAGAERTLRRALAIREAKRGPRSAGAAESLNSLGALYFVQGLYGRAQLQFERALDIRQDALGPAAPEVAKTLHNLASVFAALEQHGRAEPLVQRELSIWASASGDHRPEIAFALTLLGNVYRRQGSHDRARPLLERALALRTAALGPRHPDVAQALSNLGNLERVEGRYEAARGHIQEALAIREATFGPRDFETSKSLYDHGVVDWSDGRYGSAVSFFDRAVAIAEERLKDPRAFLADTLRGLPNAYAAHGMYTHGEPFHDRGLTALDGGLASNPLADPLAFLAMLGLMGRCERSFQRAREIHAEAFGPGHPLVAEDVYDLGAFYLNTGRYDLAEPLFRQWLAVGEKALGSDHPFVAKSLFNLAQVMLARGRLQEALPLLERGLVISEKRLRDEALDFSSARMASFLGQFQDDEVLLYTLLREHPDDARVRRLALATALLLKGRTLEEAAAVARDITGSLTAGDSEALAKLLALRTELAEAALDGPGERTAAGHEARLKELAARCDALEGELARRSAPLRALRAPPPADQIADRVAAALPEGAALVELVAYAARPPVAGPSTARAPAEGALRYLALVLLRDGRTGAADLGPAEPIDAAAARLRDALSRKDAGYLPMAQSLHALVIKPLLPLLGGARHLYVAPDGQLSLVPFAALHDGQRFLVDAFDVTYLTSGKDLLRRAGDRLAAPAGELVVVADPDYGVEPPESARTPALVTRGPSWDPLPGTRLEAEAIRALFPGRARVLLGRDATKEALLGLRSPAALVVGTHAVYLDDGAPAERARGVVVGTRFGPPPAPADPLLRSWLVMAGAKEGGAGQGMISALELAGMDLWGTQLVVLSACDTGLGEVRRGQGVYGLRRALFIAGAETVVMSLWQVNDDATGALMQRYYRNLAGGGGRTGSLREAMLAVRAQKPHPYYWAPFIAAGIDAPLSIPRAAP